MRATSGSTFGQSLREQAAERAGAYCAHYVREIPHQLGLLIVVDTASIETQDDKQYDLSISDKKGSDRKQHEKAWKNMNKTKTTITQTARIIERLQEIGFELEQNESEENPGLFFIRLSVTEAELMEAAQSMPLEKRLKPILVKGEMKHEKVVEGGYIPYSLTRADAYNNKDKNQRKNLWPALMKALPRSARKGLLEEDNWRAVYENLCPYDQMPLLPGTNIRTTHHDYPGIFEKPDPRDATPDSLFTDTERYDLMMWLITKVGGIDVDVDSSGVSRLSMWTKPDEKPEADDDDDNAEKPVRGCCAPDSKPKPLPSYETNPRGLMICKALTSVHDPIRKRQLLNDWANAMNKLFKNYGCGFFNPYNYYAMAQPIDEIRDYLGVKVALYFLFIGHFLAWLWVPAIFGVVVVIYQYSIIKDKTGYSWDSNIAPYYTFFIIMWAIFFLEYWKRKQFHHAIKWGTQDFESRESYRKEWLEMYELLEGTDDPSEVDPIKADELDDAFCVSAHGAEVFFGKALKGYMTGGTIILCIAICILTVFSVLIWAAIGLATANLSYQYGALVVQSCAMVILGMIYKEVAVMLNKWENHRTDIMHEDALISKSFIFEFINRYSPILYIAFGKPIFGAKLAALVKKPFAPSCLDAPFIAQASNKYSLDQLTTVLQNEVINRMLAYNGTAFPWSGAAKGGVYNPVWNATDHVANSTGFSAWPQESNTENIFDKTCTTDFCLIQPEYFNYAGALAAFQASSGSGNVTDYSGFVTNSNFGTCAICTQNDCIGEIESQLLTILLIKAIAFKFIFWLIPEITKCWYNYKAKKAGEVKRPWYEHEYELPYYADITDNYAGLAIMFGYVILFSSAFPLAPLILFFVTAIELRTDAYAILTSRRVSPKKVSDMGTWFDVFEILSQISILTNIALICFVSKQSLPSTYTTANRWMMIVIMEHLLIFIVWVIKRWIPDISYGTLQRMYEIKNKLEYIHRLIRYKQYYVVQEKPVGTKDGHPVYHDSKGKEVGKMKRNTQLDPMCDPTDEDGYYLDDGNCLTKSEMASLHLEQLIGQEEALEDKDDDNFYKKNSKDNGTIMRKSDARSIFIAPAIPAGQIISKDELIQALTSQRGNASGNNDVENPIIGVEMGLLKSPKDKS